MNLSEKLGIKEKSLFVPDINMEIKLPLDLL
jgi:hypothetical protein